MTLQNVIILIKSALNKDKKNTIKYYKIFLEKCSYQLVKKQSQIFCHSITMLRFGETKNAKEKFYAAKKIYRNLGC